MGWAHPSYTSYTPVTPVTPPAPPPGAVSRKLRPGAAVLSRRGAGAPSAPPCWVLGLPLPPPGPSPSPQPPPSTFGALCVSQLIWDKPRCGNAGEVPRGEPGGLHHPKTSPQSRVQTHTFRAAGGFGPTGTTGISPWCLQPLIYFPQDPSGSSRDTDPDPCPLLQHRHPLRAAATPSLPLGTWKWQRDFQSQPGHLGFLQALWPAQCPELRTGARGAAG